MMIVIRMQVDGGGVFLYDVETDGGCLGVRGAGRGQQQGADSELQ
jgi:hypothetical protein